MTEPEKINHWKSLADQLGAAPSESGSTERQGPSFTSMPTQPPEVPSIAPPRQATIRQAKADWEALAGVLGLSDRPSIPPETAPERTWAAPEQDEEEESVPLSFEPPAPAAEPTSLWQMPAQQEEMPDPLEMSTEPFVDEIVDAVELDVTDVPDALADETEGERSESAGDERRRRRRRRRRRGRRPEEPETVAPDDSEAGPEPYEDAEADLEETRTFADESDEERETEVRRTDDDSGDENNRRRRRRRRRRRVGPREESPRRSEAAPAAQVHDEDMADDGKTIADILGEDEHDEEDERGEPQLSHKKIPSWQEAIEVVVTSNIAQRSKHPPNGPRGRGRRDR